MSDTINGSPELHGEQGAESQDGNPARSGLTADDVTRLIEASLTKFAQGPLNKAISTHVNRVKSNLAPSEPKPRESDQDDDAEPSESTDQRGNQQGPSVQDRKWEAKLAKLEKQLNEERQKREQESQARAQAERDSQLRRVIEKAGVRDVEAVFRYVKPDLKVGDDGTYYAETDDGVLDPSDYVSAIVKSNDWMAAPSTKGGGRATPERATPNGGGGQRMTEAAFLEAIEKATTSGDMAKHRALMESFDSGKLVIEG